MIDKRIQKLISIILLVVVLLGVIPRNLVYANDANYMNAKLINFFKSAQGNIDMSAISESELRVYGVFLSNFYTPGETQIKHLSKSNGDDFANKINTIFFNNSSVAEEGIVSLNDIIYKGVIGSLKDGQLYDSSGNVLTGQGLLDAMTNGKSIIQIKRSGGFTVAFDLSDQAMQGAFKILASYCAGYMLNKDDGVRGMSKLYLDAFGNIWGAFTFDGMISELETKVETQEVDLHLVLPACLNPLAFLNTAELSTNINDVKLPLNNSFAMGALVEGSTISDALSEDPYVPYYNIPKYLSRVDQENSLTIYGISSPFDYLYDTDKISSDTKSIGEINGIVKNFSNSQNKYSNSFNYKIVMTNRLDVMKSSLQDNDLFEGDNGRKDLYNYLFGTLAIDIDKTNSDIYYFGNTSSSNSWAKTDFSDIGMIGINMFGTRQDDGSIFIHDSNQKITQVVSANNKVTNVYRHELHSILGSPKIDAAYLYSATSMPTEESAKPIGTSWWSWATGKTYFVHGIDMFKDSKLYHSVSNQAELKGPFKYIPSRFGGSYIYYTDVYSNINTGGYKYPDDLEIKPEAVAALAKETVLFHTLHTYAISGARFSSTGSSTKTIGDGKITVDKTGGSPKNFTITNKRVEDVANWPGIFWGYMIEMLNMLENISADENDSKTYDIDAFQSKYLPMLPEGLVTGGRINLTPIDAESGVANSENLSMEETQKDLIRKIYGIVSDESNSYRDRWLKTTLDGFLISTHKAITGSWLADIATVSTNTTTSYSSVVGYIHTPSLFDLPFTSWIMNNYMEIYILALLIVIIFIIFMVLLNMRTWQQGVMIFLLMSVGLLLPNVLIENTVNIGNKVADSIYSDRFDFWALSQHQQSLIRLQGAVDTSSMDNLIAINSEKARNVYSQEAGVKIKWMAPKKSEFFSQLFDSNHLSEGLATNLTIYRWLFSSFVYEQEFVSNDTLATYMYRPYNAIASDALEYYKAATDNTSFINETKLRDSIQLEMMNNKQNVRQESLEVPKYISYIYSNLNTEYSNRFKEDFYASAVWGNKELLKQDNVFEIYWSVDKYVDVVENVSQYPRTAPVNKKSVSLWGLGNTKITDILLSDGKLEGSDGPELPQLPKELLSSTPADIIHLVGFYKHTESPFYYFYNTLKYRYGGIDGKTFKSSLLNSDVFIVKNNGVLSNSKNVTNTVRDFLDLEGLFTNIIPYMSLSNDYVYGWTSVYGTEVPEYSFSKTREDFTQSYNSDLLTADEQQAARNKASQTYDEHMTLKRGMESVWNMYCPWVDQLNSLDIHNEKVSIGGKRVNVQNILSPSYYLKAGRPMIFSEADMIAKGYNDSDLSDIERRIQSVLDKTYKDMQYLVNYYDMDNEVLINAAAMYATFNFNREFSENKIFGDNVTLYPQGFEMKNFNYDAFMRLVILNSTGETIFSADGDLYDRVLSKTSFFTGLMLLITDILGVILIPTMKLLILLMLMFLGILLCITCVVCPPEKLIQSISNSLLIPALTFLVSNVVFSFLVSLLVGEGMTSHVGAKGISITTHDPTITILLLILLNSVYCVVLFKIIKMLYANYKKFGISTFQAGLGIVTGLATTGFSNIKKLTGKVVETGGKALRFGGGFVTGSAMAEKGYRLQGGLDGGMLGARGESVYNTLRREQRFKGSLRKGNLTDDIDRMASGDVNKSNVGTKTEPKTENGNELNIEAYTDKGTRLGNRLEDLAYTKNKIQDNFNKAKHKVKRTVIATGDVLSGRYLKNSIEQGIQKDANYRQQREVLNIRRSEEYKPIEKTNIVNSVKNKTETDRIIEKMRGKKGDGSNG